MQNDQDKSLLRAIQYYYIDGTFELTFGAFCLILGAFFFIQAAMPENLFSGLLLMGIVLIVPGGVLLKNKLVKRFKERITYPRSGYVSYRQPQKKNRISLGVRAIVGALIVVMIMINPQAQDWIPGLSAFFFAFMLTWVGYRSTLRRFLLLGILVFLIGILFSFITFGEIGGLSLFYLSTGLLLVVSGGLTLRNYLRDYPRQDEV